MLFTRDDEHEMEVLMSTQQQRPLVDDEKQRLREIQDRYDVFIADGVRQLREMANRQSPRPAGAAAIQLPRNMRFFVFSTLLATIATIAFCFMPAETGNDEGTATHADVVRFIMMIHTGVCLLLALAVTIVALRYLTRVFLRRALLMSVGVILCTLAVACLVAYVYLSYHPEATTGTNGTPPRNLVLHMILLDMVAFAFNAYLLLSLR